MIHDYLQLKINESYKALKLATEMSLLYYQKPLILTYSGGKDSDVMLQLAIECLKPTDFEVLNSHTTVDAPETVYYIREKFKELESMGIKTTIQYPRYSDGRFKSMWNLIEHKQIAPTRLVRYCCEELKEVATPHRFVATGVRAAESSKRASGDLFAIKGHRKKDVLWYSSEHVKEVFETAKNMALESGGGTNEDNVWDCNIIKKAKHNDDLLCQPIFLWTDSEVWQFIHDREMKYNPLYDQGFYRVGCIGCPLSSNQVKELEKYPKYKQNYINAFQRMVNKRKACGKPDKENWKDGESVYKWWVGDDSIPGQMDIYSFLDKENKDEN